MQQLRKIFFWFSALVIVPIVVCLLIRLSMDKDHIGNTYEYSSSQIPGSFPNKYPIVLHHGVTPIITLHHLARALRAEGYLVYSTQISAANSYKYRASELAQQLDRVLRGTGATKVNIIAHSMGGIDARYLISSMKWSDRVASLSTISSPHRGTVAAELMTKYLWYFLPTVVQWTVGLALDGSSPFTIEPEICFAQLTRQHMRDVFNPSNPDSPEVYYQSWAGVAGPPTDVKLDFIHFWSYPTLTAEEGPNDGIISEWSARWGNYRGRIPAPHSSQVGKPSWLGGDPGFDALDLFRNISEDLVNRGF